MHACLWLASVLTVALGAAGAWAQSAPASQPAKLDDPCFWIARAADLYMVPKVGTDVESMLEALAWSGDHGRLRKVAHDCETLADRGTQEPNARSYWYAVAGYGHAIAGDGDGHDRCARGADATLPARGHRARQVVLVHLARAAAARGDVRRVDGLAGLTAKDGSRARLYAAAALVAAHRGDAEGYRRFTRSCTDVIDQLSGPGKAFALDRVWGMQLNANDLAAAIATVETLPAGAERVRAQLDLADQVHRNEEAFAALVTAAADRMSEVDAAERVDLIARLAQVTMNEPSLRPRVRELVPLAEDTLAKLDAGARARSVWRLAALYGFLGDGDRCRQTLAEAEPVTRPTVGSQTELRLAANVAPVAFALVAGGRGDLAEQFAIGLGSVEADQLVLQSVAFGYLRTGGIDEGLKVLARFEPESRGRRLIVQVAATAMAERGQLDQLLRWSDGLSDPDERRWACFAAAQAFSGRSFTEHSSLML